MRMFRILIAALMCVVVACGDDNTPQGGTPQIDADLLATQQARAPFYTSNPVVGIPAYMVSSDKHRLAFVGWGGKDSSFTLDIPEGDYRRIIMRYTMCSEGSGPAEMDNTVILYLRNKADGTWYELARLFTPFGNGFDASWQKHFYIDVTEFAPLLQGETEVRYHYGGFDASEERAHAFYVTFYGYKGEAESTILGMTTLYDSSLNSNTGTRRWAYGVPGYDIEATERLGERTVAIPEGTREMLLRLTITGHGHDLGIFPDLVGEQPASVAEFAPNTYSIEIDGVKQSAEGRIFYSNADNYEQAGTYYIDRANWAPGNPINVQYWSIEAPAEGYGTMTLDINLERFESKMTAPNAEGVAQYITEIFLFGFDK